MDSSPFDDIVTRSLREFAADTLSSGWLGKEHDWVNRYAHGYLLKHCLPSGPLREPGQVAIEVGVPQPPGYQCASVRRDLVIWPHPGSTCWDADWKPVHHPMAILEWKVHRIGHRNRDQPHERDWLRRYTAWQPGRVSYAVEIDLSGKAPTLTCSRFHAGSEDALWLQVKHGDHM